MTFQDYEQKMLKSWIDDADNDLQASQLADKSVSKFILFQYSKASNKECPYHSCDFFNNIF